MICPVYADFMKVSGWVVVDYFSKTSTKLYYVRIILINLNKFLLTALYILL